jgi:CRP/FNR family transcriptional regulator
MTSTPDELLKEFFITSKPSFFKKGDVVLRIGDRGGAYYLKKGYIKDSSVSADGREFILFIFQPNDIFSYNWIFNQKPNDHSFRAITDCVIYEKSREGLLLFLEQQPEVALMITKRIVKRLNGLMQRMENLAFDNALKKVGSILCILGERFGKKTERGVVIQVPLTQQDIANLIGLSRETTSIEMKKIMEMGILTRVSGLYVIIRLKELQKISSFLR